MKLYEQEIKLDNPKRCRGCPCFATWRNNGTMELYKKCEMNYYGHKDNNSNPLRPNKCITENGK